MKNSLPAAAWAWLIVLSVASFLTWGRFTTSFPNNFGGFSTEIPADGIVILANAWKSNLTLWGMQIPNWLPIIAAFGAAGVVCARAGGADLSPKLPKILLIYAIAHVVIFALNIWNNAASSLGIGTLITLFALGGLWKTIIVAPAKNPVKTPII